jgi:hypothetical protein
MRSPAWRRSRALLVGAWRVLETHEVVEGALEFHQELAAVQHGVQPGGAVLVGLLGAGGPGQQQRE